MKILYIDHYAGSPFYGMEVRPYHLAQEWLKCGHQVLILAASFSHVRTKQPDIDELFTNGAKRFGHAVVEKVDGIDYYWYATPSYDHNGLGRVKNIWAFLRQVWADTPNIARSFQPDAVIASSTYPMDIWVAHRLVKQVRQSGIPCCLVFELHDLWPLSPVELGGMSAAHPFILLCQAAENYAYKHVDAVVSILPKVHKHVAAHGLDLQKLHLVPNGIVEQDWLPENQQPLSSNLANFLRIQKERGNLIIGYAGAHGQPNALEYLLEAAKLLQNEQVAFVLVGKGLEKGKLQAKVQQEKLGNVFFFDPVQKTQIPSLLSQFDIAYIGWQHIPIYCFGISPNKLVDYMMAACAILHSAEAGNDLVKEARCGLTVAPEDPQAIAKGVMKLYRLPEAERREMGQRGKEFVLTHQTYSTLAKRFLEALQQ